ncbi:hypothetical protein [Pseudoteredinibacter isoporae]|uniref:hypothetical protein n=1 Tax=Pseudoteredinibacter isoporae TaxID=570281 RepID=UPI003106B7BF
MHSSIEARDFAQTHWEKVKYFYPLLFPEISWKEVIEGLASASPQNKETCFKRSLIYFGNDKHAKLSKHPDISPDVKESPEKYLSRITEVFSNEKEYLLVINDAQILIPELHRKLISPFNGIFSKELTRPRNNKASKGGSDLAIFIGRYPQTPIGIHKDPNHNFFINLLGEKSIFVFPDSDDLPNDIVKSKNPSKFLYHGEKIDLENGKAIYWHPSVWHTAENNHSGVTVSLGLGIF